MQDAAAAGKTRDLLSRPRLSLALFWLPAIAIAVAGKSDFSNGWRTIVWTGGLTTIGTACTVNAVRCGRVHCYITGPFFLVMALLTLLYGLGVVPLGRNGWTWIGLAILVGGIVFCCVPELLLGKYRKVG